MLQTTQNIIKFNYSINSKYTKQKFIINSKSFIDFQLQTCYSWSISILFISFIQNEMSRSIYNPFFIALSPLTFPDLTFSAHRGPYCGIPRATSNHANTVGALHRSMGTDAASLSKRSFSAQPSSVSGDHDLQGSKPSEPSLLPLPPLELFAAFRCRVRANTLKIETKKLSLS